MADRAVWLDVDAGLDDAQGIFLLVSWLKNELSASLVGISCVAGNVEVGQVAKNVKRILSMAGADSGIPVFVGCSRPLVQPPVPPSGFFGKDGLGDVDEGSLCLESVNFESSDDNKFEPKEGHAALHLTSCARRYKKDLTLIATGPLSTIALACRLDDAFPKLVGRVVIMGGSSDPTSGPEFNFSLDPEAAHVCLDSFPVVTLVTWECGISNPLPWDWFYSWLAVDSCQASFMKVACKGSAEEFESDGFKGYVSCDVLAMAAGLNPDLIRSSSVMSGEVQLGSDRACRGGLVLTPSNENGEHVCKGNLILVQEMDMTNVLDLLMDAFQSL